jgi:SH3-like domain-containing protein
LKHYKKVLAVAALSIGIGAGAILTTPTGMKASSNVVLASVDWVNSKINPISSDLNDLKVKVNSQQATISQLEKTINNQQNQIDSLKGSNESSSTPNTNTNTNLPSIVYVNNSSATIHRGASRTYTVVATKSKGSALKVIDSFNSSAGLWYRVSLSSTLKGWIYSGDIKNTTKQVITTGDVNLRKGATTKYPVVILVKKNTTLKYIQSFKNSSGETWYNVETSSGQRGWIISSLGEVK